MPKVISLPIEQQDDGGPISTNVKVIKGVIGVGKSTEVVNADKWMVYHIASRRVLCDHLFDSEDDAMSLAKELADGYDWRVSGPGDLDLDDLEGRKNFIKRWIARHKERTNGKK